MQFLIFGAYGNNTIVSNTAMAHLVLHFNGYSHYSNVTCFSHLLVPGEVVPSFFLAGKGMGRLYSFGNGVSSEDQKRTKT